MKLSRKSAIKSIGVAIGSAGLGGFDKITSSSSEVNSKNPDFNIRDYGAEGDGQIDDTHAINDTISAAAEVGGGKVIFPAGTYRTGSIRLKSNITLYLGQGAVIEATDNPDSYDKPEPLEHTQHQDFGHSHWHNSLIWGEDMQHITIEGPGMIYGKGLIRDVDADHPPSTMVGDKSIALKKCRNVTLKDFTIRHGGHFGVLATGVDNFTIDNLTIDTNRDGINIDCCRHTLISNCNINSPRDDAIVPKSSYALGYARSTQDLVITNCIVSGYREGTVIDGTYQRNPRRNPPVGRIKLGTESNGGFKNITISNCVFEFCRGLALETVDGGALEDVSISNITMRDIGNAPIFLRLGNRMRGPKETPVGKLRRVNISNVVVHNASHKTGVLISGISKHPIEDISINNIQIQYEGGGTEKDATLTPPENTDDYPEPNMFGKMPSYGMYLRHIDGVEITNAKFSFENEEFRPPFVLQNVSSADFRFIKTQRASDTPMFLLNKVKDFSLYASDSLADTNIDNVNQKKI